MDHTNISYYTNEVYDTVVRELNKDSAVPADITVITVNVMIAVQKIRALDGRGEQKKEIVIEVIKKIVMDSQWFSEDDQEIALLFIEVFLPNFIDIIVDAYKRRMDLKKKVKKCWSLCR